MKKQRHTEEQIIQVLHEVQASAAVDELRRRHGVSQATSAVGDAKPFAVTV